MLNNDGTPNKDIFGKDMLHMNADGYAIWKKMIQPYLLKN
jgi:lysophospholipase L1-like esterase